MLLCPRCKNPERRFEVERSLSSAVIIECHDDGDYTEASEFVHYQMWHRVLCLACRREVDEKEARDCFEDQPEHMDKHVSAREHYRFFRGRDTRQVDGVSGTAPYRTLWYYEPLDYEGDTLWSTGYLTRHKAVMAAREEMLRTPEQENEPWHSKN